MKLHYCLLVSFCSLILPVNFIANYSVQASPNNLQLLSLGLGKGINFGNQLDDIHPEVWRNLPEDDDFNTVKKAGFDFVRIPVMWSYHTQKKRPYKIDPEFLLRVDYVVSRALSKNFKVIINIHHYTEASKLGDAEFNRFIAIWKQLSFHYRKYSKNLIFEVLNEPRDALTPVLWNRWQNAAISLIRKTNPKRLIVVTPAMTGNFEGLKYLELPVKHSNLILSFHYYAPSSFTQQGAWFVKGADKWLGTKWPNNKHNESNVSADFNYVARWALEHKVHNVLLGEFGVYSAVEVNDRVAWIYCVRRTAEFYRFNWAYWEFRSDHGLYNPQEKDWHYPLLNALMFKNADMSSAN